MASLSKDELITALHGAMSVQVEIVRRLLDLPAAPEYDPILDSLLDLREMDNPS